MMTRSFDDTCALFVFFPGSAHVAAGLSESADPGCPGFSACGSAVGRRVEQEGVLELLAGAGAGGLRWNPACNFFG